MSNTPSNIICLPLREKTPTKKENIFVQDAWEQPEAKQWLSEKVEKLVEHYLQELEKGRALEVNALKEEMIKMFRGERMLKRRKEHLDKLLTKSLYFILFDTNKLRTSLTHVLEDLPTLEPKGKKAKKTPNQ